jgi:hypothetical protein
MSASTTKATFVTQCNDFIAQFQALANADPITLGGKSITKAEIIAPFLAFLAAAAVTVSQKLETTKAVAVERAVRAAAQAMRKQVKPYLQGRLGATSPDLTKYGYTPAKPKPKPPTVTVKAEAVAKARATREARHTVGKKARKAIKATPSPATPPKT